MAEYFDDGNPRLTAVRVPTRHDKFSLYAQDTLVATPENVSYLQHQLGGGSFPAARESFDISTDPLQADKATEIRLFSFARPHMRAFHYSWISFFIAFFGWFSIPPLMPTIKTQLKLTEDQIANTNIAALSSTIVGRLIVGPLCDRYGARSVQAVLLVVGAIPVASTALAIDYSGFMLVRFFIGLVGCTFVATAYWTSTMFSNEVVGSANAIAAGWGTSARGSRT